MIDLHYWPTPNGWKISIMLEECGLPYRLRPVNIGKGEQFAPEFLAISPNNRMPAIVDHAPAGAGEPVAVFESGAILIYLAEKTGRFLPADGHGRYQALQWLMWQMGGLGPMAGQNGHFLLYAPEKLPYAIERYGKEVNRLYGVLDARLARTGAYVAGADYSIADMAIFPWTRTHKAQQVELADFPHVQRWYDALFQRPAVKRGLDLGKELRAPALTDEACLWLAQDGKAKEHYLAFIEATFAAYFSREEDISQDAVLAAICRQSGIDADAFLAGIAQPGIKEQLKANTDEAIRRGAFGSPTFFVGDDMYFGNDRLPLVRAALLRARG